MEAYTLEPLTDQEVDDICQTHNWIKVKRHQDDPSKSWEDRFSVLASHHLKETEFLIAKVRELAARLRQ
jgi:hypothetical protein